MPDSPDEKQQSLELSAISFSKGKIGGRPCVLVYNETTDKTMVIAPQSMFYAEAMAAIEILIAAQVQVAKPEKKTILHKARAGKLILPGSHARN